MREAVGRLEYGQNIELFDSNQTQQQEKDKSVNKDENYVFKSRVHHGELLRSFSAHSQNSSSPPCLLSVTCTHIGDIVVTDRNNKCVRFYKQDGAMYRKIHASDSLWGVCCLANTYSDIGKNI